MPETWRWFHPCNYVWYGIQNTAIWVLATAPLVTLWSRIKGMPHGWGFRYTRCTRCSFDLETPDCHGCRKTWPEGFSRPPIGNLRWHHGCGFDTSITPAEGTILHSETSICMIVVCPTSRNCFFGKKKNKKKLDVQNNWSSVWTLNLHMLIKLFENTWRTRCLVWLNAADFFAVRVFHEKWLQWLLWPFHNCYWHCLQNVQDKLK